MENKVELQEEYLWWMGRGWRSRLWSCLKQSWIKVAFAGLVSVVPGDVLMGSIRLSIYINTSMCRLAFHDTVVWQARDKVNELSKQVFKQKRKEGLEER